MKKIICVLTLLVGLCGCVNLTAHFGNEIDQVYGPTELVWKDGVCVWWSDHINSKYPVEASFIKFTWLFWVVDWPCELVLDTVTFPYDYFKTRK